MRYPLELSFKLVAINPQVAVTDATGELVLYVKQKAFRLREAVTIFADREMTRPLYRFRADRVIDFRAVYRIEDAAGNAFGSLRSLGMKSLWRSRYEVEDAAGTVVFRIHENNPWVKVADALLSEIPIVGALSGYLLHPSYTVELADGTPALMLTKQPAFWEGRFRLEELVDLPPEGEVRGVLAAIMMIMLQRVRG
jgi:uncharacterized protein YxjI